MSGCNCDHGRRGAIKGAGAALGVAAAVGGGFSLAAMKRAWDPLPSVKAAGFTEVDVRRMEENVLSIEKWRGKPIFVLKKTKR